MLNDNLQTFVVGIIMAAGVSLSACNGSESEVVKDTAVETVTEQTSTAEVQAKSDSDMDGATVEGVPVKYDLASWPNDAVEAVDINELDGIVSTFGKVVSKDESSLDYASNPATKYRFMQNDKPYLDVIDSQKYLEFGWYYANPTDSDSEKELSQKHAKKVYQMSRQLMGDEGGKVLNRMLNGQIIKNETVGGQKIELAKCEFYSCMLVLNKSAASPAGTDIS